jgi:ASC-1-like (ASCH) protein
MSNKKHLSQPWFDYIKSGEKTIEGRLNKDFWSNININDIIIWYNDAIGTFGDNNCYKSFKTKIIKKIFINHLEII